MAQPPAQVSRKMVAVAKADPASAPAAAVKSEMVNSNMA